MASDKESGSVRRDLCPFCGRPFKRLKTHLPHCKMAPVAKVTKSSVAPLESCSPILEHTASKRRTTAVVLGGISHTDSTKTLTAPAVKKKSAGLSVKTVAAKVSPSKKITPKNSQTSDLSSGPSKVKPKAQEKEVMMKMKDSDKSSRPGGGREAVSAQKERASVSLKTGIHSRTVNKAKNHENTKEGQHKRKAPDSEMQETWMPFGPLNEGSAVTQNLLGSLSPNVKAEAAGRELRAQEMASSRSTPAECHVQDHKGAKTDVWGHIKNGLTGKSCRHLLTADPSEAALRVVPAFKGMQPHGSLLLTNQAGVLSKQRPENLFLRASDGSALCHNPTGALWEPCGRGSRVAGLEWTPELATAYRGIGFSMLPLWCPTEHIKGKPLPVQPTARQVQGTECGIAAP